MTTERAYVYKMIDTERTYQDSKWGKTKSGGQPGNGERSVDEFALYIAGYTNDLVQLASHYGGQDVKLAAMRKVAALCVACFEQHGCPPRNTHVRSHQWPVPAKTE